MDQVLTQDDVRRALSGDTPALRRLVVALTPIIQARVTKILNRRARHAVGRNVRQEVEDLSQEVFLLLFAENAKVLSSWQPERGLSLKNFVGLVAERQTLTILRSGKKSPWKEDPTLAADLDGEDPVPGPEARALSRQHLRRLLERLHCELSPLGRHLFDLLFVRETPVAEVTRRTSMSPEAVYAWRSRLRRLAHRLNSNLGEPESHVRKPSKATNSWVEEP